MFTLRLSVNGLCLHTRDSVRLHIVAAAGHDHHSVLLFDGGSTQLNRLIIDGGPTIDWTALTRDEVEVPPFPDSLPDINKLSGSQFTLPRKALKPGGVDNRGAVNAVISLRPHDIVGRRLARFKVADEPRIMATLIEYWAEVDASSFTLPNGDELQPRLGELRLGLINAQGKFIPKSWHEFETDETGTEHIHMLFELSGVPTPKRPKIDREHLTQPHVLCSGAVIRLAEK